MAIIIILLSTSKNSAKYQVSLVSLKGGFWFFFIASRHHLKQDKLWLILLASFCSWSAFSVLLSLSLPAKSTNVILFSIYALIRSDSNWNNIWILYIQWDLEEFLLSLVERTDQFLRHFFSRELKSSKLLIFFFFKFSIISLLSYSLITNFQLVVWADFLEKRSNNSSLYISKHCILILISTNSANLI